MKLYRHYKGRLYNAVFKATFEPTGEDLVVYIAANQEGDIEGRVWVRTRDDFYGYVDIDGKQVRRFEAVDEVQD